VIIVFDGGIPIGDDGIRKSAVEKEESKSEIGRGKPLKV